MPSDYDLHTKTSDPSVPLTHVKHQTGVSELTSCAYTSFQLGFESWLSNRKVGARFHFAIRAHPGYPELPSRIYRIESGETSGILSRTVVPPIMWIHRGNIKRPIQHAAWLETTESQTRLVQWLVCSMSYSSKSMFKLTLSRGQCRFSALLMVL